MKGFIQRKDGRIVPILDGTRIDRRTLRRATATDEDFRLPNDVDAILAFPTDKHHRRRDRTRAWGY